MVKDENFHQDNSSINTSAKGTRFLGAKAVAILNQWLIDNKNYTYPDENTTDFLAHQAEISSKQVIYLNFDFSFDKMGIFKKRLCILFSKIGQKMVCQQTRSLPTLLQNSPP